MSVGKHAEVELAPAERADIKRMLTLTHHHRGMEVATRTP